MSQTIEDPLLGDEYGSSPPFEKYLEHGSYVTALQTHLRNQKMEVSWISRKILHSKLYGFSPEELQVIVDEAAREILPSHEFTPSLLLTRATIEEVANVSTIIDYLAKEKIMKLILRISLLGVPFLWRWMM